MLLTLFVLNPKLCWFFLLEFVMLALALVHIVMVLAL